MKITVTEQDWNTACEEYKNKPWPRYQYTCLCLVAQAIKRNLDRGDVAVYSTDCRIGQEIYALSIDAIRLINWFDADKNNNPVLSEMLPCTFELKEV